MLYFCQNVPKKSKYQIHKKTLPPYVVLDVASETRASLPRSRLLSCSWPPWFCSSSLSWSRTRLGGVAPPPDASRSSPCPSSRAADREAGERWFAEGSVQTFWLSPNIQVILACVLLDRRSVPRKTVYPLWPPTVWKTEGGKVPRGCYGTNDFVEDLFVG